MAKPAGVKVVLSDLDDTLFDHRRAAQTALAHVHAADAALSAMPFDELDRRHRYLIDTLHLEVLAGRLTIDAARVERFRQLTAHAGGPVDGRAAGLAAAYRRAYEDASHPVPGGLDLAAAIREAGLPLVIVTNNIVVEQRLKLDRCRLTALVDHLVTSEEVGILKPGRAIFDAALERAGVGPDDAVMLGDSWSTDIIGARAAGIRPVWLNRFGDVSPNRAVQELTSLEPVETVLSTLIGQSRGV